MASKGFLSAKSIYVTSSLIVVIFPLLMVKVKINVNLRKTGLACSADM